ncbi:MAG: YcgN family cysteine cluster protein [Pseudomonadota bacterium]
MTERPSRKPAPKQPPRSADGQSIATLRPRFWELPLDALQPAEWEALCDGCGKCCVIKLEDSDTGQVHYTDIACRLFDPDTCRCGNYALRQRFVPGCVVLAPATMAEHAPWLPNTCAYRLRHYGQPLPPWHPLLTGRPESVAEAGHAAKGTVPEWEVAEEDLEDHIVEGFLD